jgi:hypothetical protein
MRVRNAFLFEIREATLSAMRLVHLLLLLCCSIGFPACSALRHLRSPESKALRATAVRPSPERVGVITLVNERDRFVVVDVGQVGVPASGTALKAFRDKTETAVLAVGDVRRRPFIVGDIVSGDPKKGDEVFK